MPIYDVDAATTRVVDNTCHPYADVFEREERIGEYIIGILRYYPEREFHLDVVVEQVKFNEASKWGLKESSPDSVIESIIWTLCDKGILRSTMNGRVGLARES